MIKMPPAMFPHTVTVRPYAGAGGHGPSLGQATTLRCLRAAGGKLVRDPRTGEQVTSTATLYCPADTVVPPQSLVIIDGVDRTVMSTETYDPGGLPLPGSVVLHLQ